MQTYYIITVLIFFFVIELLYFKIAGQYNIIDKPNSRSSHTAITIRGGGILFSLAVLSFFFSHHFSYPYFTTGLFLIAGISFLDDIHTLNNKVRIFVQLISILFLLYQLGLFSAPIYISAMVMFLAIGTINAYNFMDGINGITGFYSLVVLASIFYVNQQGLPFVANGFLIFVILSLLVFNFFNFRKKAKCFAGDVGSISIAFIIVFLIGLVVIHTQHFGYVLFLLVYGLDAVITIGLRFLRKENIFEAHRSHFYQFLANEKKIPHLYIAIVYGLIQFLINIIVIHKTNLSLLSILLFVAISTIVFIVIRVVTEGKVHLLKKKDI